MQKWEEERRIGKYIGYLTSKGKGMEVLGRRGQYREKEKEG